MTIAARAALVPAMTALLSRLAGITAQTTPDGKAAASEGMQPWTMPGRTDEASLSWTVFSYGVNGVDEQRSVYDPDTTPEGDTYDGPGAPLGAIINSIAGQRRVRFQVNCESRQWEQDGAYYLERIQARLRLPSALDELDAMGLALAHVGDVIDVAKGQDDQGRVISTYALEFQCNAAVDVADDPVTTIEKVNATLV